MKLSNKIKVHPLTFLFLIVGFLTGYFKYMVFIMAILSIHELGHIFVAILFKKTIKDITVLPFGGLIDMNSLVSSNIFEDILIAIAGVAAQTLFGFLLIFLNKMDLMSVNTFTFLNNYNMMIIIFNLLPICPLDGYKIFKCFLELFVPFKATFIFSIIISISVLLGVIAIDYSIILDNSFVFMFLVYATWEEANKIKYIMLRFYVERMNRKFAYPIKYVDNCESMYKNKVHFIRGIPENIFLENNLHK